MNFRPFVIVVALASGCTCSKPAAETPPAELAKRGIVIDQPAEGAKVTGAWVSVAGWVAPEFVQHLAVMGAPAEGFYEVSGHVGVPSVPVTVRKDGRFFAPRVPLQDGEVELKLIPFSKGGESFELVTRKVTASETNVVPATLVIEPSLPKPGEKATLRATTGTDLATSFQWDFDGDGTFDAEGASVTHAWARGRYQVVARTKVKDVWVSAVSKVSIDDAPAVLFSAPLQKPPRRIGWLGHPAADLAEQGLNTLPDGGAIRNTSLVFVCHDDEVRFFDENLVPKFVLTGLSRPSSVTSDDEGNLYVADTGTDRIVRYTGSGQLDTSWGRGGELREVGGVTLKAPTTIVSNLSFIALADGTELECKFSSPLDPQSKAWDPPCERDEESMRDSERLEVRMTGVWRGGFGLTTSGRLVKASASLGRSLVKTRGKVILDATRGLTAFRADFATIDSDGVIDVYREGSHDTTYVLPYKATNIVRDGHGRLYVAGPGVIELRNTEPLR